MTETAAHLESDDSPGVGYQVFVLLLSLSALFLAAALALVDSQSPIGTLLEYADLAVCVVFLVDFCVSLFHAPNKLRYLVTWGWLDAISAIPAIDFARWGRAARIFRVLRVLRALRATRTLATLAVRYRVRNAVLAAALVLLLTVFACSVGVLHFESDAGGKIRTAQDALWWAMSTVTTVGYGDLYPVTWEGRSIAALLMLTGVGVFSALAGAMSSLFLTPSVNDENRELQRLSGEVAALRKLIERSLADRSAADKPSFSQSRDRDPPTSVP